MSNVIHTKEHAFTLHGVEGRMFNKVLNTATGLFVNQTFAADRPFNEEGYRAGSRITVEVQFDDNCRNGKQSFAITGHVQEPRMRDWSMGGCIHEEIAKYFPELAHLIRWHLFDTSGPMYYVANTVYHASNRDHNGLLKGEQRQIVNGRSGLPSWRLVMVDEAGNMVEDKPAKYLDSAEQPQASYRMEYRPWMRIGEGKERDLDAARRCAVWPEATDEQLCAPRAELEAALLERAPALLAAFRTDMESAGMLWEVEPSARANDGI